MRSSGDAFGPSLEQFTSFWWGELCKKVAGSVVFIDNQAAECLHWNCGGAEALFNAGAVAVKELSSFESGAKNQHKGVFVASQAIVGATEMAVRDVVLGSRFTHCVVVTAAPATVHSASVVRGGFENHPDEDPSSLRAFVDLENRLLRWMKNDSFTAEVLYCPLFAAQLLDDVFVMPPFQNFPSLLHSDLPTETNEKEGVGAGTTSKTLKVPGLRLQLLHLAACLHSLMAFLGAKEEVYAVGRLAALLAHELEVLPAARLRRKTAQARVSIVLVDRALDLASACNLDTSICILDRIAYTLPRFPGHGVERRVDMSPLCKAAQPKSPDASSTVPLGCALQPGGLLSLLEARSNKEVLLGLQRQFLEVAPGAATMRVNPEILAKKAKMLAQGGSLRQHATLLQKCMGILESLIGSSASTLDLMAGLQKVLLQNLAVGGADKGLADVLTQVSTLIQTRKERGFQVDSALILLIHAFSLAGPDSSNPENLTDEAEGLQKALASALLEDCSDEQERIWVSRVTSEEQASVLASQMVQRLFDIAQSRKGLSKFRELVHRPNAQQPAEVSPLLPRLLSDCLDPTRPEMGPDVLSVGAGSLRHTLGMFLSSARHHPSDCPLVIVLVLGGVTGAELQAMKGVASKHGRRLVIGATGLASQLDALNYLSPAISK